MDQKKKKILVVDQEADIRGFLQTVLENRKFDVILATHEQDGIQKYLAQHPDLLILDALLPNQGMQTLLNHAGTTPVLFISTIPLKVLLFRHKLKIGTHFDMSGSVIPFLEKPLQEDDLITQIELLMQHMKKGHENE